VATVRGQSQPQKPSDEQGFRFKSGVELVNVTATVSDASGRFVPGLRAEDFRVFEDDQPVSVTHFSAERAPVSLGIALDTSGSMVGEKIQAAQSALDRFLYDLLDRQDELFLYRFSNFPTLLQGWTTDRQMISRALGRIAPNGGTAMYDTVAEAIPLTQRGANRKKALLVISDGNDTSSRTSIREVKQLIRESEVLVYAIGIDGESEPTFRPPTTRPPIPFPFPPRGRGGRGGWRWWRWHRGRRLAAKPDAQRRPRERRRASGHDRRQRRPHRDRPSGSRPESGDREHRRRAEQAVLSRISGGGEERWTLAFDPRGSRERQLPSPRAARLCCQLAIRNLEFGINSKLFHSH